MTALPSTRQAGAVRPMQAAYRRHITSCRVWCWLCAELMKAADTESGQGFAPLYGWPDDERAAGGAA